MNKSRTVNVAKNMSVATVCQMINIVLSFVCRTIFIRVLGADYLGVNGLFTNILTVLSFAELGIGNAMIFSMYKPLAQNQQEKIRSLMALYKNAYRIIGFVVGMGGLSIIPWMDLIIKDPPIIKENLLVIYILYLLNTVISYNYVYKKTIIIADQKKYIVSIYDQVIHSLQVVLQIIILLTTHHFILFIIIQIVCTITNNVLVARRADKMYPYLKKSKPLPLVPKERRAIFTNVKALVLYKLGSVILNGTDNIIISAILGVTAVGYVSNYLLIFTTVATVLNQIASAFTASVGNLNATANMERKEEVFRVLFFITVWLYGYCAVGLFLFSNQFIELWINKQYVLDTLVILALSLHFYVNNVQFTAYTYRTTMGYFVQGKYAPVVAAILNITLSIILAYKIGLAGIFFATSISRLLTMGIVDPMLVYKKGFAKSPMGYFMKYILYIVVVCGIYFLSNFILSHITIGGWVGFFVKLILFTIVFHSVLMITFFKSKEFMELFRIVKAMIAKRKERKNDFAS